MNHALLACATALVAVLALGAESSAAEAAADAVPGEVLVRFEPTADPGERTELRKDADTELESVMPVSGLQLLEVEPEQSVHRAVAMLQQSDEVAFAEPNFYRRSVGVPSDPSFSRLWGLHNTGQTGGTVDADIDAPEAWDLATGLRSVSVAVVDSGVAGDHPDLQPNLWANPGESGNGRETNRLDDDANGHVDDVRGWDWVQQDNAPIDPNGHGTHVAGTIAANGNDAQGIPGVGWRGNLMALRVLDDQGNGTVANLVRAYRYAAESGAKVVNASLAGGSFSQSERAAIAGSPGTLFVAAAGNGGSDSVGDNNEQTPQYPCNYDVDNVVCVAATDKNDSLAGFSNYGLTSVDLAAPGVSIYSTQPAGAFAYYSGTSMAAPHVAGVAALVWARKPSVTVTEAKLALLTGADTKVGLAGKVLTGGRLNVQRTLLAAVQPSGTEGLPVPPLPDTSPDPEPRPAPKPAPKPAPSRPAPAPSRRKAEQDRSAPRASLAVTSARAWTGRIVVRVACNESCRFTLKLVLDRRTAKRLGISRRGAAVVGRASGRIAGASRRRVHIRLMARVRKKLMRARGIRLTLVSKVTDAAGNSSTTSRKVRVRR